jgi:DNA-binding response OmpR family regulator
MSEPTETRPKILVIDDDAVARRIIDVRLRENGFRVAFAFDAVSAVSAVRSESPDLIVLDIGLPGGNGFVVMDRLSRIQTMAHIPIVVLSADETARDEAITAGAAAFVEKAADLHELVDAIRRHVRT